MRPTPVSLYPSRFGSSVLFKPLETPGDKCHFLECYLGLDQRATTSEEPPKQRLGVTLSMPVSAKEPDVFRNELHVDQLEHHTGGGPLTPSTSQSINEGSPVDDENESSPSSTSSKRPKPESTSAGKPGKVCIICNVSFLTASNFNRHRREKHKESRFPCDRCGNDFSRASYAKKHNSKCHRKPPTTKNRAIRPRMS